MRLGGEVTPAANQLPRRLHEHGNRHHHGLLMRRLVTLMFLAAPLPVAAQVYWSLRTPCS
jgi:hypothetical protein